jgi:hypothetical protein
MGLISTEGTVHLIDWHVDRLIGCHVDLSYASLVNPCVLSDVAIVCIATRCAGISQPFLATS